MYHTEKYMAECTRTIKKTCDICGSEIQDGFPGAFESAECWRHEIKHEAGTRWSDGGSHIECTADICGKCFREKVKPALEAIGVTFQTKGIDW